MRALQTFLTVIVASTFVLGSAVAQNETSASVSPSSSVPSPSSSAAGNSSSASPSPSSAAASASPVAAKDPCADKARAARADIESLGQIMKEAMQAFQDEFKVARENFSKSNHSAEEWDAFHDDWKARGHSVGNASKAQMEASLMELLGDCFESFKRHMPPMGPAMDRQGKEGRDPHELPPPPKDDRGQHGKADQIRRECMEKVKDLMGERRDDRRAENKPNGSRPMPPPPGPGPRQQMQPAQKPGSMPPMDEEKRKKMEEAMRMCDERVRESFQEERAERKDDFDGEFGSLKMYFDEASGLMMVEGRFIALQGSPESQQMQNFTCEGIATIDRLFANGPLAEFRPEQTPEGHALRIYDSSGARILGIHDNPRCVINFSPSDEIASLTIDLSDDLVVEATKGGDLRFKGDAVEGVILLHGGEAEVGEGNEIILSGKATFLVKSDDRASDRLGEKYQEAIEKKKIGAELKIGKGAKHLDVDEVPLGDMQTNVSGEENKVVITIDSADGEGKTVSFEFARELFSSDDLVIEVMAIGEDGNESMVDASEASSLADVLEPADDGPEGVEYWIVEDKNGFQVLISFAHFSEKRVTVQSAEEPQVTHDSIPGFEMPLVLMAAALVSAFAVRRRKA
jgi:hypothetical protein